MCEPATLTMIAVGLSATTAAVSAYSQYQTGKKQTAAIEKQNEIEAGQIADAAGVEMSERARAARRERAASRANASESGINLGSGSFLASLQTSLLNQTNDMGLISRNESNQQKARQAKANSAAAGITMPTAASAAFSIGTAAAGTYVGSRDASGVGAGRASGG